MTAAMPRVFIRDQHNRERSTRITNVHSTIQSVTYHAQISIDCQNSYALDKGHALKIRMRIACNGQGTRNINSSISYTQIPNPPLSHHHHFCNSTYKRTRTSRRQVHDSFYHQTTYLTQKIANFSIGGGFTRSTPARSILLTLFYLARLQEELRPELQFYPLSSPYQKLC